MQIFSKLFHFNLKYQNFTCLTEIWEIFLFAECLEGLRPWQISIIFNCYINLGVLLMPNLWNFLPLQISKNLTGYLLKKKKKNLHTASLVYLGFYRHLWISLLQAYCYSFPTATILWLDNGMLRDSKCNRIHVLHKLYSEAQDALWVCETVSAWSW